VCAESAAAWVLENLNDGALTQPRSSKARLADGGFYA
jgi:hypothetical protein